MSERETTDRPLRVPVPNQRTLTRADLAGQFEAIAGRRVILADGRTVHRDYRVWGEVEVRPVGFGDAVERHPFVPVVSEYAWWAQRFAGRAPAVLWWPAGAAWVEDDDRESAGA